MAKRVIRHAERAKIRAGAADGGVDFLDLRLRIGGAEPVCCEIAPAVHRCDGATKVGNLHFLAGLDLLHEVSHARAHAYFLRRDGTRINWICEYADGKRRRDDASGKNCNLFHVVFNLSVAVFSEKRKSGM